MVGYLLASGVGFLLLLLPWARNGALPWVDVLFTAVSAVSTTGLVTVPTGESYTFLGEVLTLLLFQVGGLGYMSVGSFVLLQRGAHPTEAEEELAAADFSLPEDFDLTSFAGSVIGFTALAEAVGALALLPAFLAAGVEFPVWMAIYHSVSAFCTAGFSLFPASLEGFAGDGWVSGIILVLALVGATGFLVVEDIYRRLRGRSESFSFTTRVVLRTLLILVPLATAVVFLFGDAFQGRPLGEGLLLALFQAGSAATTVGFHTLPTEALSPAIVAFLMALMVMGAAPGGTGGGVKLTTVVTLLAVVRARLRGHVRIHLLGRRVSSERVTLAATVLFSHVLFMGAVAFLLLLLEDHSFQAVAFEVTSAMGTVGLSLGITDQLSTPGRILIMVTMLVGRLRTLTFGLALLEEDGTEAEREEEKEAEEERAREEERRADGKEAPGEGDAGPAKEPRGAGDDAAEPGEEPREGEEDQEADEEDLAI